MRPTLSIFSSRVARRVFLSFLVASFAPLAVFGTLASLHVGRTVEQRAVQQLEDMSRSIGQQLLDRLLIANDALSYIGRGADDFPPTGVSAAARLEGDAVRMLVGEAFDAQALPPPRGEASRLVASDRGVFLVKADGDGALVAEVDASYLWDTANLLPFGMDLCVFHKRSLSALFCTTGLSADAERILVGSIASASRGRADWLEEGEPHIAVHWELFLPSRFDAAAWSIVVDEPTAVAYAARSAFNQAFLPTVALSSIVVLLLTLLQIRRTLDPLAKLAAGTRAIARRDFGARIDVATDDELGELGRSMNDMVRELGRQFDALTAFAEIDRMILSTSSLEQVVEAALTRAAPSLPGMHLSMLVLDPDDAMHGQLFSGPPAGAAAPTLHRIDVTDELASWLVACGEWRAGQAADLRSRLAALPAPPDADVAVVVPIRPGDRLRGALIGQCAESVAANADETENLRELARRLAVAVSAADRDQELFKRAHFDELTGLPNRQLCMDRLRQAIAHARRERHALAVLFIDLDGFKNVNDSLGHPVGDKLLCEAAERLRDALRETETVARLGGDEYVVVLPHVEGPDEVETIAGRILSRLSRPYLLDGQESIISASIGAALFPDDGGSVEELLRRADTAMYSAKDAGRARCMLFSGELDRRAHERLLMHSDLSQALANHEFELVYQPQLVLATGQAVGAEALLRWRHPTRGDVPPGLFIDVLEQAGFIESVGRWVIKQALHDLARWRADGLAVERIAVNLASRQLLDRGLVSFVAHELERCGLDGSSLELELTEHSLVSDFASSNRLFGEFRSMGVRIAIDDFGTGYSSLGYLRELEFDALKIDRAFVSTLSDSKSGAIVEAVLKIAHALHKEVVAEGIETVPQYEMLTALDCDLGQGYLFSPPIPRDACADWLRAQAAESSPPTRGRVAGAHS